jgi:hypothetical protein
MLKHLKKSFLCFLTSLLTASLLPLTVSAQTIPHPNTYVPTLAECEKHKKVFDDPRPFFNTFSPKHVLPKGLYEKLTYDVDKMKNLWAELIGFRAPDEVGKIAPEIKPGKYSYRDLEKFPGLKQLMYPQMVDRIKPGGPPHTANIPEFEIVPTRQYYWPLPVAEATKENLGKTKLDKDGYIITETWVAGYPFPRPSGPFKAQQIMADVIRRSLMWGGNFWMIGPSYGFNKNLKMDFDGVEEVKHMQLAGRTLMPPYGFFDDRAKKQGELKTYLFNFNAPRDVAGVCQSALFYLSPDRVDQLMLYIPSLRRVRKMTATDAQDPIAGKDAIYDDTEGFNQKLSPTRNPYKYEVLEEREYLIPAPSWDGSEYISSKGYEYRNVKFERRPMYVVKMTQLDPNYVYSYRILYIDKELLLYTHIENYDRKGRLYRTWDMNYSFFPEMGGASWHGSFINSRDYVDKHSSLNVFYEFPAFYSREDMSLAGMIKREK